MRTLFPSFKRTGKFSLKRSSPAGKRPEDIYREVIEIIKLTRDEKKLLESYETGELKSVPNLAAEIARHQKYARTTLKKNMRVNIRLSAIDVQGMKQKAFQEGIPYQTLMSSIIHKYVIGKLAEKIA